jgi:predicted amidohydrolase
MSPAVAVEPHEDKEWTVAALQLTSTEDVEANLQRCEHWAMRAAQAGARLIGFPENFAYLGSDQDHKLALAEDVEGSPGPVLSRMKALAQRTRAWLLLGGFPEKSDHSRLIRNTCLLLDPEGRVAATYRKIHLFDVDVPGGLSFRESAAVEPGLAPVVADLPGLKLGLSICYDLRFPELYRRLVDLGADLLAVPSAFTAETGKDHWHLLLRARAVENTSWLFAPAQFGQHGGRRASYGHALIVDPWGVVVSECGQHEGFALATIDLAYAAAVRRSLPCLAHRRL